MFEAIYLQNQIDTIKSINDLLKAEGDFSKVYKATCNIGAPIALKVIRKNIVQDLPHPYEEGLKQLNHENICQVISAGMLSDGRVYYCLEFIAGGSLENVINSSKIFKNHKIISLSLEILRGLMYLEAKRIIHGDIKPGNILLTKNEVVKISDFGLSYQIGDNNALTSMIYNRHRSPECSKSTLLNINYQKTIKDDIYAFGVTLYRLIVDNKEFKKSFGNTNDLLVAIRDGHFPDRNLMPAFYHKKILKIIDKCMEINPDKRFNSFVDIQSDLKKIKCCVDWTKVDNYEYSGFNNKRKLFYSLKFVKKNKGSLKGSYMPEFKKGKKKESLRRDKSFSFVSTENVENRAYISKLFTKLNAL